MSLNLLLVDDEELLRDVIVACFKNRDVKVTTAEDGKNADGITLTKRISY